MNEFEYQPSPAPPPVAFHAPPRTPNLGHTALFLLFAIGTVFAAQLAVVGLAHLLPSLRTLTMSQLTHIPLVTVLASFLAYTVVLGLAVIVFPSIWHRSFARGISWNAAAVMQPNRWFSLPMAGIGLALLGAVSESFQHIPKNLPVDQFFQSRLDLWLVTILGTLLAPAFEEICFRGFLLPSIAIAWDWALLPRTPEGYARWQSTDTISSTGLAIGAVLSSVGFALMHGKQLSYTFGPLPCASACVPWRHPLWSTPATTASSS